MYQLFFLFSTSLYLGIHSKFHAATAQRLCFLKFDLFWSRIPAVGPGPANPAGGNLPIASMPPW